MCFHGKILILKIPSSRCCQINVLLWSKKVQYFPLKHSRLLYKYCSKEYTDLALYVRLTTWRLHYPQCSSTTDNLVGDITIGNLSDFSPWSHKTSINPFSKPPFSYWVRAWTCHQSITGGNMETDKHIHTHRQFVCLHFT